MRLALVIRSALSLLGSLCLLRASNVPEHPCLSSGFLRHIRGTRRISEADMKGYIVECSPKSKTTIGLNDPVSLNGTTPLMALIESTTCTAEAVNALLEVLTKEGADINARRKDNWTALHLACSARKLEVVKRLVAFNADVNAVGPLDMTPLHFAVQSKSLEMVKYFASLEAVDPGMMTKYRGTVLHTAYHYLAFSQGSQETKDIIAFLVETMKMDPSAKDITGVTPEELYEYERKTLS